MSVNRVVSSLSPRRRPVLPAVLPAVLVASALLGACASAPLPPSAPTPQAAPVATPAPAPAPAPSPAAAQPQPLPPAKEVAPIALPAHLDPKSPIANARTVYFDFDDARLKQEFQPLVERHGNYLVANPKLAIRVEGHTDERGGAEYNLALGQKRAESVRKALALMGVPESRIEAVSWGKERAKAAGHDEAAWAQNRRAEMLYPGK